MLSAPMREERARYHSAIHAFWRARSARAIRADYYADVVIGRQRCSVFMLDFIFDTPLAISCRRRHAYAVRC